ncbi:r2r3-MYB transcription factor [Tritrichomonas foetus]|uniref:R2r3-MYB transcription factor n=1 Tax=Tritrichomonas foetus TaxID=1144522 RepID=A0A1J4KFT0_9EUKA|nr:r2r3-MYB transcription factor [Tritrichomonas foetus]|eukprot:OHT09882.1 r2r3-MYB transcription factor [Tritrichomonas foetus]
MEVENSTLKKKFTDFEDNIILEMVEKYGTHYWKNISQVLGTRTPRQCRERWRHYLKPEINYSSWTLEEDRILETNFSEFGPKWSIIATFIPGRTQVNVKNRWARLCRHKKNKIFDTFSGHNLTLNAVPVYKNMNSINSSNMSPVNVMPFDCNGPESVSKYGNEYKNNGDNVYINQIGSCPMKGMNAIDSVHPGFSGNLCLDSREINNCQTLPFPEIESSPIDSVIPLVKSPKNNRTLPPISFLLSKCEHIPNFPKLV